MYGSLEVLRYDGMGLAGLTGSQEASLRYSRAHLRFSDHTLGLRYLIERTVKCNGHGTAKITIDVIKFLLSMAIKITDIDYFLETIYNDIVIPQELIISSSHKASFGPTAYTKRRNEKWLSSEKHRVFDRSMEDLEMGSRIINDPISEDEITGNIFWQTVSPAYKSEKGYDLTEWFHMQGALITFFDHYERLKVVPRVKLLRYITSTCKQSLSIAGIFLNNHTLSAENMSHLEMKDMLPAENFWRDFRVTNRPLVEISRENLATIVYGVETTQQGMVAYFRNFSGGRLQVVNCQSNGPLKQVMGQVNENAGNVFRDEIIKHCQQMGIDAIPEKRTIKNLSPENGIGPIDVLIYDKFHARFVLIEAKDPNYRITPRELKQQKEQFIGPTKDKTESFLDVLDKKERWFNSKLDLLKEEFGLSPKQPVSLVSVIVVSHNMRWLYFQDDILPILNRYSFFEKLASGRPLQFEP